MAWTLLCGPRRSCALGPLAIGVACHAAVLTAPSVLFGQASSRAGESSTASSSPRSRATDLVGTGRSLFEDQRYEESIQTLSAALLRPGTPKQDRVEVYKLLAYNYIALSQTEEAEAAVRGLYALDPEFALASTESPRFREFFGRVKKRWEADGRPGVVTEQAPPPKPVSLQHGSPVERPPGAEIWLTGELQDPGARASTVLVRYRTGSQGKFQRLDARVRDSKFRVAIPGAAVKPPLVEYYIEALDSFGLPLASRGDAAAPLRIAVPAAAASPAEQGGVLSSPWFWTSAGALVLGGVVAAVLLTRKSESPAPDNTTPTSRVVVIVSP
jgi:hypothetical protein